MEEINNKKRIFIWGTGRIAEAAYLYYKEKVDIIGFIEFSRTKWNSIFHGLPVFSPSVLKKTSETVILAMGIGLENAKEWLINNGIDYCIQFKMEETYLKLNSPRLLHNISSNDVVIRFSGGLGNQMFQYALYRYYRDRGNVYADLSYYDQPNVMPFILSSVFPQIRVEQADIKDVEEFIFNILHRKQTGSTCIHIEKNLFECDERCWNPRLLDFHGGYLSGSFQYHELVETMREVLIKDYRFQEVNNEKIIRISEEIRKSSNAVSVHFRRGDYLNDRNKGYFSEICTENYYKSAMEYIDAQLEGCCFFLFSDEPEWLCEKFRERSNIRIIDQRNIDQYEDWYDMYLMSICKHNIIANSTFSWWSAWLNNNPKKIVIAPSKWINGCECPDVYLKKWILINSEGVIKTT